MEAPKLVKGTFSQSGGVGLESGEGCLEEALLFPEAPAQSTYQTCSDSRTGRSFLAVA